MTGTLVGNVWRKLITVLWRKTQTERKWGDAGESGDCVLTLAGYAGSESISSLIASLYEPRGRTGLSPITITRLWCCSGSRWKQTNHLLPDLIHDGIVAACDHWRVQFDDVTCLCEYNIAEANHHSCCSVWCWNPSSITPTYIHGVLWRHYFYHIYAHCITTPCLLVGIESIIIAWCLMQVVNRRGYFITFTLHNLYPQHGGGNTWHK